LAQQGADLPWQLTRRSELGGVLPVARRGRVVDEEHDSAVGRLLQYGREQRLAYDARFLLVGGDQDRQCRRIAGMDTVQGRSGLGTMRREPFQVSQPRDLVDQAGEQEKADQALPDEQVGKGLIGFFLFTGLIYQITRLGYLKRLATHRTQSASA